MKHKDKQNKKWRRALAGLFVVILLAVVLLLPTNYVIEAPGDALAVGNYLKTSGVKSRKNLYFVTVSERRAVLGDYLWSFTQPYEDRMTLSEATGGSSTEEYEQLQKWYMQTSQQTAIYYAAKKAGLKPKLKYRGVYVMSVQSSSSFKKKLMIGDTIVAANGRKFQSVQGFMSYLQKQQLGQKVTITVLRSGKKKTFSGKIVKVKGTGKPGIGISMVERVKVQVTPKTTISVGDIGGPSAGLMFSLACYQNYTGKNLTKGHKVAGTGTIDAKGNVGIIGGVDKKVVAAAKAGAEVFFAPT
ncbi:SepM family pheromone-processing serine protease, partial [Lactobacillus nasalidis]